MTTHLDDLELDDTLRELRALAPSDLSSAAPDWPLAEQHLLDELTHTSPHRASWLPRIAIAAALVVVVGGAGVALTQQTGRTVVPAAPVPAASSAATAVSADWALRPIPEGKYLVRRAVRDDKDAPAAYRYEHRVDWFDSTGQQGWTIDGNDEGPIQAPDPGLVGLPADLTTAELAQRLVGGPMGTYSPRPVSANSPTPDPDELLWGRVAGFLDDPRTSKAFRNQLVNIVATLPNSTVSREGSSVIVRHTVKQDGVTFTDTLTFDAATLDLLTHDSHPSSRTGTIKGVTYPHVVITYQPVEITSHRP